jgi:type IV secretion system protein VirD4
MKNFFYNLHILHSRLSAHLPQEKNLHPGRFAYPHELASIATFNLNGSRLLMAEGKFNHILTVSPTETQQELAHLMLIGRSRCGKGLAIESNMLNWSGPLIANDIKRELAPRTAGWRVTGLGGRAFYIDPTDPKGNSDKYDPLEGKFTDSDLQSAATILLYKGNEGENSIFTDSAIIMLTQIFHAAHLEEKRLLPFAQKMIYEGLIGTAVTLETISQKHNAYPNLATRFLDVNICDADFSDKYLRSCWGTLTKRLGRLLTKESVQCFTESDFTAKDIITSEKPITVYLCWPEKDLLALSPLVHLIWTSLMDGMLEAYDAVKGEGCKPVLTVLDEIGTTGLPKLPQYASTAAGRNISLLPVFQSLSQIDAQYGKKAGELLDNIEQVICYRPGSYDSRKRLSDWLGDKSGFAHSQNKHESEVSEGESEQRIPLMTPQDIKKLGDEEVIGFYRDLDPFRARRLDWRRFPTLSQRRSIPPPPLPILSPLDEHPPDRGWGSTKPESSWRLNPDLLRWGNQPAAANGLRKNGLEDGKGWA